MKLPAAGGVEVVAGFAHDWLTLTVRDTGIGIRPSFLPYVFDRFRQADGSVSREFGGLGLGLSIVRALVELHGGLAMNPPDVAAAPAWVEDSIFHAAHDAGLRTGVSGTDWFAPLIPKADLTTSFFVHDETDAADQASTDAAVRMIEGDQVDFLLVHLNEVDHAGHHSGGGASPAWRAAATKADARLRAIAGALDLTRDTLVVFSDHGHLDQGGHGGPEDIVVRSPLVLAGSGVRAGATVGSASAAPRDPMTIDAAQADLAPTLAALLGTRVLRAAQGQALTSLLTMDASATDTLHQAQACLLYTSPSPPTRTRSRMPSSA